MNICVHDFFFKISFLFIYFRLHQVLVAACGTFVAACGTFVEVRGLFMVAHGLLSSCGMWVFSSLVVARGLQGTWAL